MGKKRVSVLGSENEAEIKAKDAVKRQQKKLREGGKTAKAPGLHGGERVVDTAAESLVEYEQIQKKLQATPDPVSPKPVLKKIRSRAYKAAKNQVNVSHNYALPDAIKLLRDISLSKTNNTVELHLTLKEKGFSKEIELPHSTGKTRIIATADDTTLKHIAAGHIDFDVLLASPVQMSALIKFAKVLGPKGLMPNPKTGTVVDDPQETAKKMSGKNTLLLKTEKDTPVIHTVVGKLSMTDDLLTQNISAVLAAVAGKSVKVVLKSTMSPAIKLSL